MPLDDYEAWLVELFDNTFNTPLRYENSTYGPTNGLLTGLFKTANGFVVVPQCKLRKPIHAEAIPKKELEGTRTKEPEAGASGDDSESDEWSSYSVDHEQGYRVQSRIHGAEKDTLVPDFAVFKASEEESKHILVAIVECKRSQQIKANAQLKLYMERAREILEVEEPGRRTANHAPVIGLIVDGQDVVRLQFTSDAKKPLKWSYFHGCNVAQMDRLLHPTAESYKNPKLLQ